MKFLFAPDSFKGSMTSKRVIELLSIAANQHFPGCEIRKVPMADGGEGTIDAIVEALSGSCKYKEVRGPRGTVVSAKYGVVDKDTAIIEMAESSGLPLLSEKMRNPLKTSSYGAGELICHVLNQGYTKIYLTLGGSATNDGGMGAANALGIGFLNEKGEELEPIGENLGKVAKIDLSRINPHLENSQIILMCDVDNPLYGEKGATYVYGEQKGGTKEQLDLLEKGMIHYGNLIEKTCHKSIVGLEGAGAAGGFAVPFLAFTNAIIQSGIKTVLELIHFEDLLEGVDLVVTGEGRLDWQSVYGKVLYGVGNACKRKSIPAVAIVGSMGQGASDIFDHGIISAIPTVNSVMSMETAMDHADELFLSAADRMFRFIKVGMNMEV
ncbi:MAG TPA: glycerate kinase [Candidatus Merdenecus merdavium]|nr:glycerate kinase [Candidatus Merdenecus merdavium]